MFREYTHSLVTLDLFLISSLRHQVTTKTRCPKATVCSIGEWDHSEGGFGLGDLDGLMGCTGRFDISTSIYLTKGILRYLTLCPPNRCGTYLKCRPQSDNEVERVKLKIYTGALQIFQGILNRRVWLEGMTENLAEPSLNWIESSIPLPI